MDRLLHLVTGVVESNFIVEKQPIVNPPRGRCAEESALYRWRVYAGRLAQNMPTNETKNNPQKAGYANNGA